MCAVDESHRSGMQSDDAVRETKQRYLQDIELVVRRDCNVDAGHPRCLWQFRVKA